VVELGKTSSVESRLARLNGGRCLLCKPSDRHQCANTYNRAWLPFVLLLWQQAFCTCTMESPTMRDAHVHVANTFMNFKHARTKLQPAGRSNCETQLQFPVVIHCKALQHEATQTRSNDIFHMHRHHEPMQVNAVVSSSLESNTKPALSC